MQSAMCPGKWAVNKAEMIVSFYTSLYLSAQNQTSQMSKVSIIARTLGDGIDSSSGPVTTHVSLSYT